MIQMEEINDVIRNQSYILIFPHKNPDESTGLKQAVQFMICLDPKKTCSCLLAQSFLNPVSIAI